MKKVIVSINIDNSNKSLDMEANAESSMAMLLTAICSAYNMGNSGEFRVFAAPPGRWLDPNETLEEAGVWDGAMLTLKRIV